MQTRQGTEGEVGCGCADTVPVQRLSAVSTVAHEGRQEVLHYRRAHP